MASRLSTQDMARPAHDDLAQDDLAQQETTPQDVTDSPAEESGSDDIALVDDIQAADFLDRWSDVQARFVDDPQGAVRDGDSLVAELMQLIAERFAQHKSGLERHWQQGAEPDTEDLRLALQQYRSFFQRLLTT